MTKTIPTHVLLLTAVLLVTALCLVSCTSERREAPAQLTAPLPGCGDGILNSATGEQCDDGNQNDTDSCVRCRAAVCGDGVVRAGVESCDDGNTVMTDACTVCMLARCGDGYVWAGKEECDDGNLSSGDGCSEDCRKE